MRKALEFMNAREAARFCGVDRHVFERWIQTKKGPPRRLIGKRFYYQRIYLTQWLEHPLPPAPTLVPQSVYGKRFVA